MKKILLSLALSLSIIFNVSYAEEWENPPLYVNEVYNVAPNVVEVYFSNEISEASLGEDGSFFRIFEFWAVEGNNLEEFEVVDKKLDEWDKEIVILTLDRDLEYQKEYTLIVMKIQDIYWQDIIYWVDSQANFINTFLEDENSWNVEEDLNSAPTENNNEEETNNNLEEDNTIVDENNEEIDLNSAEEDNKGTIWGTSVDPNKIENQVDVVAGNNDKLPTAWAEHIVILIMALLIWATMYMIRFKKS